MTRLDVTELNSPQALADLVVPWQSLLDETPGASVFQTPQWLALYWRHFGARQKLRLLAVGPNGDPVGIVPLTVRRDQTAVGPLRVLTYPLHDWAAWYGPIGADRETILSAAMQHVAAAPRDWDVVDLRWVDPEIDAGASPAALQAAGFQAYAKDAGCCAVAMLHGDWRGYWMSLDGRWRSNVNRCRRRVIEGRSFEYIHHRPLPLAAGDGNPRWDLYDQCVEVARRSWQGSSTTGNTLSHDEVRAFLRDAHALLCGLGAVDLHLIRLDGRPAAFAYNYHYRGYVHGLRSGFDPEVSQAGLGTLMVAQALEQAARLGDRIYDLGPDYLEAKRRWATALKPVVRYTHFAWQAPRAQALRLSRIWQRWTRGKPADYPPTTAEGNAGALREADRPSVSPTSLNAPLPILPSDVPAELGRDVSPLS